MPESSYSSKTESRSLLVAWNLNCSSAAISLIPDPLGTRLVQLCTSTKSTVTHSKTSILEEAAAELVVVQLHRSYAMVSNRFTIQLATYHQTVAIMVSYNSVLCDI